jgi:uncharacterized protein (DUF2336 family)
MSRDGGEHVDRPFNVQESLTDQLEQALASRDLSRRADILHRVADLFMLGTGRFSADQIELFDAVMSKLIEAVEVAARAAFGSRLASVADAPRGAMRKLAFDNAIEVAGPVLTNCQRLDDEALSENARNKSQLHLLAISRRSGLAECVTDILLDRGNDTVVISTASNPGAKFSTGGIATLVARSRTLGDLAKCVWARPDIPRSDLMKLFAQASDAVRKQLQAADPRRAAQISAAVANASDELQNLARAGSHEYASAHAYVKSLHSAGKLDEARLNEFAQHQNFDSLTIALSLLCDVPVGLTERALVQSEPEQLMILARAIGLSWETTKRILCLHAVPEDSMRLNHCLEGYLRLKPKTAQTALQFYRMRDRAKLPQTRN